MPGLVFFMSYLFNLVALLYLIVSELGLAFFNIKCTIIVKYGLTLPKITKKPKSDHNQRS